MDGYKIPAWADELKDQIKTVIRIDDDSFIVFINKNNEIDWKTSEDYDKKADENGWALINSTSSKINFLRSRIPAYLSDDLKSIIFTLLGEATVSAFHNDKDLTEKIISESENRIKTFSSQESRSISLLAGGVCLAIAILAIILLLINGHNDISCFIKSYQSLFMAFFIGAVGSFFSIIIKSTNIAAEDIIIEKTLIYEVVFKIIAGAISGVLIVELIKSGLFPISKTNNAASYCFAFMAGFAERLVPSIISKHSEVKVAEDKKD